MSSAPVSPYKGLTAFDDSELDALLFFGREREREIVVANLIASRLTVLYGPSGVGKSSLFRASVARSLRELPEEPLVVVFSSWSDDPAVGPCARPSTRRSALRRTARAFVASSTCSPSVTSTSSSIRRRSTSSTTPDDAGEPFARALPAHRCTPAPSQRPHLAARGSLAKLDRFTGRIPGSSRTRFGSTASIATSARAAIVGPVSATTSWRASRVARARAGRDGARRGRRRTDRAPARRGGRRRGCGADQAHDRGAVPPARDAAHLGGGAGRRLGRAARARLERSAEHSTSSRSISRARCPRSPRSRETLLLASSATS